MTQKPPNSLWQTLKSAWHSDRYFKQTLILFIIIKISTLSFVLLAYHTVPFCQICHEQNFLYPAESSITWRSAYQTWDAQHYLHLAEQGYQESHPSNAFYPLLPTLIGLVRPLVFGQTWLAGLLISNLISVAAVAMFYLLVRHLSTPRRAFIASLFLFAFPASFYLHFIYTEALFILLAVTAFYSLYRGHTRWLILACFLLPLTRPNGVFVSLPLTLALFLEPEGRPLPLRSLLKPSPAHPSAWLALLRQRWPSLALMAAAFSLGLASYFVTMYVSTGAWLTGFRAQEFFFSNYRVQNLLNPIAWVLNNFINLEFSFHSFNTSLLNRAFFILFLGLLILTARRTNRALFLYTLVLGLITALSGELDSFPRYIVSLFPVFLALANAFPQKYARWLIPQALLQLIFLMVHSLNYWFA